MTTSKVRTSAGATLSICAATIPATNDVTGFSALTFVPISEISDMGSFGKNYTVTKFSPLGSRQVVKRKGSYDPGTLAVKAGYSPTDPGQIAVQTGLASDTSSSFKMITQSGSTYYFTAVVASFVVGVGTVDQITMVDINVEIDNDVVPTALA